MYRRTKYHSTKTVYDGIQFDSKKEAKRYAELILMQRNGIISDLKLQEKFVLIPAQYEEYERFGKNGKQLKNGRRCIEKECAYKADFVYKQNGELIVEDTKGMRTTEYIIKRKLMLFMHNIKIREI